MANEPTIDFDEVLKVLGSPSETPENLRREVRRIRDAVREDESKFNHYQWYGPEYEDQPPPDEPDWNLVISTAVDIFANDSKDLWICAWLIEGLTVTHGFAGIRDGFKVAENFVEQFWDSIQPDPNGEDGIEGTIKMLASLNDSQLIDRINAIPISAPYGENPPLTCATLLTADESAKTDATSATDTDFFVDLVGVISGAMEGFKTLKETLDARCGEFAPPSAKLREALEDCQRLVNGFCGHLLPEDVAAGTLEGADSTEAGAGTTLSSNQVENREEAFRVLEKVAEFFRRTEPHSPISYALDQAVRWGRMPLPELLSELITDESVKAEIFKLAGIKKRDGEPD